MTTSSATFRRFGLVFTLIAIFAITGCQKKTKPEEGTIPEAAAADEASGDSDSGKAMGMQTVHFAYDSSALDRNAKDTIKHNADILRDHTSVKVQIEGHCDARGGIQYNIALGEKRANAVKKFLEDSGISGDRVTTISFGKERPINTGTTEEAYAKNRRGNFVITAR